jgi:tetratricopeptide (TPR) repeat protein
MMPSTSRTAARSAVLARAHVIVGFCLAFAFLAAVHAQEKVSADSLFDKGRYTEALDLYRKAGPDDWKARFGAARCLVGLKHRKEAKDACLALVLNAPRDLLEVKRPLAGLLNVWWSLLAERKEFSEAEAGLATALEKWPSHVATMQYLALAYHYQRKYDKALIAYKKVALLRPRTEWADANIGQVLQRMNRPEEAVDAFLLALTFAPDKEANFQQVNQICIGWANLREVEKARQAWTVMAAIRGIGQDRRATTQLYLGILEANAGRPERAGEAYRRALALNPDLADALNNLGILMWSAGNLDGAMDAFAKAAAKDATCTNALENMGNLELVRGNTVEARGYFAKGLRAAVARRQQAGLREAEADSKTDPARRSWLRERFQSARYRVLRFRTYLSRRARCGFKAPPGR